MLNIFSYVHIKYIFEKKLDKVLNIPSKIQFSLLSLSSFLKLSAEILTDLELFTIFIHNVFIGYS